jgi:hypothetical protein
MSTTMSDLTDPIHSVLERIPVQEVLERVPTEVRQHLPERLQPEDSSRSKLWIALLVLVGVGAVVFVMRRRSSDESGEVDLREPSVGEAFAERGDAAGVPPPV